MTYEEPFEIFDITMMYLTNKKPIIVFSTEIGSMYVHHDFLYYNETLYVYNSSFYDSFLEALKKYKGVHYQKELKNLLTVLKKKVIFYRTKGEYLK